jgi:DNA-directed RNA polymerase subunit H (RpoH/RPB5)
MAHDRNYIQLQTYWIADRKVDSDPFFPYPYGSGHDKIETQMEVTNPNDPQRFNDDKFLLSHGNEQQLVIDARIQFRIPPDDEEYDLFGISEEKKINHVEQGKKLLETYLPCYFDQRNNSIVSVVYLMAGANKSISQEISSYIISASYKASVDLFSSIRYPNVYFPLRRIIIITPVPLSSEAKSRLDEIQRSLFPSAHQNRLVVEIYTLEDINYDAPRHFLVAEHSLLSPESDEYKDLVSRGLIKKPSLLKVLDSSDKISQWYDFRDGDVVKIRRFNISTHRAMVNTIIDYRIIGFVPKSSKR